MPKSGGGSGIRTHDEVAPITVFKTVAFVHSAIPPYGGQPRHYRHETALWPEIRGHSFLSITARHLPNITQRFQQSVDFPDHYQSSSPNTVPRVARWSNVRAHFVRIIENLPPLIRQLKQVMNCAIQCFGNFEC